MNRSEHPDHDSDDGTRPGRVIDVSGQDPVIVDDEPGYPSSFAGGTERVRVFVSSSGTRGCVIPLALILLLLCCSCIVFWSLTDNLF